LRWSTRKTEAAGLDLWLLTLVWISKRTGHDAVEETLLLGTLGDLNPLVEDRVVNGVTVNLRADLDGTPMLTVLAPPVTRWRCSSR